VELIVQPDAHDVVGDVKDGVPGNTPEALSVALIFVVHGDGLEAVAFLDSQLGAGHNGAGPRIACAVAPRDCGPAADRQQNRLEGSGPGHDPSIGLRMRLGRGRQMFAVFKFA
jgi:hypothetical protein